MAAGRGGVMAVTTTLLVAAMLLAPACAATTYRITFTVGDTPTDMEFSADTRNSAAGIAGFSTPNLPRITNLPTVTPKLADFVNSSSTASDVTLTSLLNPNGTGADTLRMGFTIDLDEDPTFIPEAVNGTDVEFINENSEQDNFTITIPPDNPTDVEPEGDGDDTQLILIIVFSVLLGLLLIAFVYALVFHRHDDDDEKVDPNESGMPLSVVPHDRHQPTTAWDEPSKPETSTVPQSKPTPQPVQQQAAVEPAPTPAAEPAASTKPRDSIADERAKYRWNATANAVADPAPGGDVPLPKLANIEPPANTPKNPDDIADERARYRWNAAANEVADPPPGGDVPVPKLANAVP
eukprot:m.59574 g.59574  ORF g.59574 m.59574 type:complete len:351 (+) comp13000_c0_seq1:288-1340(+)